MVYSDIQEARSPQDCLCPENEGHRCYSPRHNAYYCPVCLHWLDHKSDHTDNSIELPLVVPHKDTF